VAWVRLDDGFHSHPTILKLSYNGRGVLATAMSWAGANAPDGTLSPEYVRSLQAKSGGRAGVKELTLAGMFEPVDGGLRIHNFTKWNPPRDARQQQQAVLRDEELRAAVRSRDRDHCRYCDQAVNFADRRGALGGTYDIVDPAAGTSVINVVTACRGCRSTKGERTPDEAAMPLLRPHGAQLGMPSDPAPFKSGSNPPARGGVGGGPAPTEQRPQSHAQARVAEAVAVFTGQGIAVNEITLTRGIENAIGAFPDKDVVLACRHLAAWLLGPDAPEPGKVNIAAALMTRLAQQPKPEQQSDTTAAAIATGRRQREGCPHNLCDGSGWIEDEREGATQDTRRCRCHPAYVEGAAA
jgi:hypothetical protein